MMILDKLIAQTSTPELTRRRFVTMTVGGAVGLALMPLATPEARAQNAPDLPPGQKAFQQPAAFVTIDKDGTTTVLCNRMDMGQGIETALAMICADELDADWAKVKTGFGNQKGHYIDPSMGMHLTGGSNSVKNSYTLLAAASKQLGVRPASLTVANGVISGGGKSATYGELFEAAMKEPIPERVVLKDAKDFKLIGKPMGLKVSRAKSTGTQQYSVDIKVPGMLTAVVARDRGDPGHRRQRVVCRRVRHRECDAVVARRVHEHGGGGCRPVAAQRAVQRLRPRHPLQRGRLRRPRQADQPQRTLRRGL